MQVYSMIFKIHVIKPVEILELFSLACLKEKNCLLTFIDSPCKIIYM